MSRDDDSPRRRGGRDEDDAPRRRPSRDDDDDRPAARSRGRDDDDRPSRGRDRDDDRGSSRRSSFVYEQRDTSELAKRAVGGSKFDKYVNPEIKLFMPKEGENNIRILPPTWKGAKHYGCDIWVHYGVGADSQTYLCLNKMADAADAYFDRKGIDAKGGADPIEEYAMQLRRDGYDDESKQASHKMRVGVFIVDRNAEKEGVQFWSMAEGNDRDIVQVSQYKGKPIVIDDPDSGYDLTFFRKGTGQKTKYSGWAIDRDPSPLGNDRWLEFAVQNPIPDQLIFYSYDHIKNSLGGGGEHVSKRDRDADDDRGSRGGRDRDRDDDRPARSSRDDADSGRDRGRREEEDPPRRRGASRDAVEHTWESVHDMSGREMEDLIDVERLDIDPKEAKDDDDLADWICDEMKLKKVEKPARRSVADDPDDERGSKLERMRRDRERD